MSDAIYNTLLIPTLIAVAGFIGKSVYDIYLDKRKRNRKLIESKLQYFYWPICIRLTKNENIYQYLYKGKKDTDKDSLDYKIAHYVEKAILMTNHKEIIDIITRYRHFADADTEVGGLIDAYIRHVSVYNALMAAKVDEFPANVSNAPYPAGIYDYFYRKTLELQSVLDKKKV
ncbi:MAG: hypothetical protein JWP37_4354 [Mucilaginibacter sp.]|nr:hypothetical protein [Mucilaginibacter sp.]